MCWLVYDDLLSSLWCWINFLFVKIISLSLQILITWLRYYKFYNRIGFIDVCFDFLFCAGFSAHTQLINYTRIRIPEHLNSGPLVSAVIKFFDGLNILQLFSSFSQFLKYDKTSSSFFNLLSWRFVIGRSSRKILTRIEVFASNYTVEANLAGLSSVPW